MKNIIRNLLLLIVIFLVILVVYLKHHYNEMVDEMLLKSETYLPHGYDCNFTKTYRIVDLLAGYVEEVPEWSYVVVDQFQNHDVVSLKIPTRMKTGLVEGKYYEFKYTIVGTGSINSMEDVNKYITLDDIVLNSVSDDVKIILAIEETSKEGLSQKNENICQTGQQIIFLD